MLNKAIFYRVQLLFLLAKSQAVVTFLLLLVNYARRGVPMAWHVWQLTLQKIQIIFPSTTLK